MPVVPREQRESYRQWAKDNARSQMDERAWICESDYADFARRETDPASAAESLRRLTERI
jgi:hypothetical protein